MRFLLRARDTINRYSVCFNLRYVKIYKISTGKKWMAIDSVALNFFVSHLVLIFVLQQRQVFLRGRPSFNLETENRISVPEGFPALFFPSRKVFLQTLLHVYRS